jgi:hypothetical protein
MPNAFWPAQQQRLSMIKPRIAIAKLESRASRSNSGSRAD